MTSIDEDVEYRTAGRWRVRDCASPSQWRITSRRPRS